MIAKASGRNSLVGRSLDITMGLIGFSVTPLIILDDLTGVTRYPQSDLTIDDLGTDSDKIGEYLDSRYGQPITRRLSKHLAQARALVTGRDVEYGKYF